jgi:hypothetical protein
VVTFGPTAQATLAYIKPDKIWHWHN